MSILQKLFPIANEKIGYSQVIFTTIIWGSYGLIVRGLPYPVELILFFRFLFGFLSILLFAGVRREIHLASALSNWKRLILAGFLSGLSWYAYTFALTYTSVANAAFLLYTAPCFVVVLAPILLKEEVSKRSLFALLVCLTGTVIIMKGSGFSLGGFRWLGDVIALSSGLFYGLTTLSIKRLPEKLLGLTGNLYVSFIVCAMSLPLAVQHFSSLKWDHLIPLIVIGVIHQGVASSLYYSALGRIKAHLASIITYLDPLFAFIFAFLFLSEGITVYSLLGGGLILFGGVLIFKSIDKKSVITERSKTLEAN